MKEFYVTIRLRVKAETAAEAVELGFNAADHLLDTFNDNETIDQILAVDAKPAEPNKDQA